MSFKQAFLVHICAFKRLCLLALSRWWMFVRIGKGQGYWICGSLRVGNHVSTLGTDFSRMDTRTSVHARTHTYIHTCMHACMHTYMHTYIHHTQIHTRAEARRQEVCRRAGVHAHTHAHTHTHTRVAHPRASHAPHTHHTCIHARAESQRSSGYASDNLSRWWIPLQNATANLAGAALLSKRVASEHPMQWNPHALQKVYKRRFSLGGSEEPPMIQSCMTGMDMIFRDCREHRLTKSMTHKLEQIIMSIFIYVYTYMALDRSAANILAKHLIFIPVL